MLKNKSPALVLLPGACVLLAALLGCRTANLIFGRISATHVPPTRVERAPTVKPTRAPDAPFDFVVAGTPHCAAGDNAASVVNGRITQNGAPVVGQQVQASSGPGGEPISDTPAESDERGNFQVTFVCEGKACDGAFWLWLVNPDGEQISPFAQFVFDKQCRRGTINFASK